MLLAPQSQGASFTATHSVKKTVYRCLVPVADKRGRDGVSSVGEVTELIYEFLKHSNSHTRVILVSESS